MKEENSTLSVFGWIDAVVLVASAAVAAGYAMLKTPPAFWISAWGIQAVAFGVVVARERDGSHWPSTVFGAIELAYVITLIAILSFRGVSLNGLAQLFFGLLFIHGILYLVAAKPWLSRRGFIKSKKPSQMTEPTDASGRGLS